MMTPEPSAASEPAVYTPLTAPQEDDAPIQEAKPPEAKLVQTKTASEKSKNSDEVLKPSDEPIALDAAQIVKDDQKQTITATGDVFLEQAGRMLRADEITYYMQTDQAFANGHVVLNEENGDIHYAEHVKFDTKLKNAFARKITLYLADGSVLTADKAHRVNGVKTVMKNVTYTPCAPCVEHPEQPPTWGIKATDVTHDEVAHTLHYKNATFDLDGTPVMYLPYFSSGDGSVKRASGFLTPSFGYKSSLGGVMKNAYYYNIAPDRDATFGLDAMTKQDPLLTMEWRQRWNDASLTASGGITRSGYVDSVSGVDVDKNDRVRGHVLANGIWDMSDTWRSGVNIAWASDDAYMRQYNFSDEDVLQSQIYAERFSGRDYAVARIRTFQDVRILTDRETQPAVLPDMEAEFTGEPDSMPVLGGRWNLSTSLLGLERSGSDQDMDRFSVNAGWQRRLVSDYGILTTVDANMREDVYDTRNLSDPTAGAGFDSNVSATRFFPQINIKSSYPMEKPMEHLQATLEPIIELTAAPNIDVNKNIPNEDSQDVQLDESNIFDPNRFPGLDRVEDQTHVTYGVRTGLYEYNGDHQEIFLGQSHRLQSDDNPFTSGSGLDSQNSDIVGELSAVVGKKYDLSYRFQLASNNLSSERHEIDANANWGKFTLSSHYLYSSSLEGTNIDQSREQVSTTAGYYFNRRWRARVGATEDLGAEPGLRKARLALDFFGQCLSWSLQFNRNITDPATGLSSTEVTFNLGLKNMGEYKNSTFDKQDRESRGFDGNDDDDEFSRNNY